MLYMPIDIIAEPSGAAYLQLIDTALMACNSFSLVRRDTKKIHSAMLATLAPFLIREEHASEWPGTKLEHDQHATICFYALTSHSAMMLKRAHRLYAWQYPDMPEDLAFYVNDGALWLGSVAHEGDSWFNNAIVSPELIAHEMPLLEVRGNCGANEEA